MKKYLKAELHCHSSDSGIRNSYIPIFYDSVMTTKEIVDICVNKDIHILSVTDHDSLTGYQSAKKYIEKNNIDITLIPGCEISSKDGHILAYNISEIIPPLLSAEETIERIHHQGGIAVAAHPFMINSLGKKIFELRLDAVEGINGFIPNICNHAAINAAKKARLPVISGSDGHYHNQIASSVSLFPKDCKDISDILNCIKAGNIKISGRTHNSLFSLMALLLKNILYYKSLRISTQEYALSLDENLA